MAIALFVLIAPLGAAVFGLIFAQLDREFMPPWVRALGRFVCALLIAPMALAVMGIPSHRAPREEKG